MKYKHNVLFISFANILRYNPLSFAVYFLREPFSFDFFFFILAEFFDNGIGVPKNILFYTLLKKIYIYNITSI